MGDVQLRIECSICHYELETGPEIKLIQKCATPHAIVIRVSPCRNCDYTAFRAWRKQKQEDKND